MSLFRHRLVISIALGLLGACDQHQDLGTNTDAGSGAPQPDAKLDSAIDAAAAVVPFQSCAGGGSGKSDCGSGPEENANCCATLPVTGGTFFRSYDGVSFTDMSAPATVSNFSLDTYDITVGRFRAFTQSGWLPSAGDGKHSYLPGGGLNNGTEPGWDPSWTASIPTTPEAWNTALACPGYSGPTWTSTPGANEGLPITCATWIEVYAFCIWDGGFLPTEAEWDYAAAGGSDQRVYPFSSPPSSSAIDCTDADYSGCVTSAARVGATSAGLGKYGQADLAGNVWERTLDVSGTYVTPSVDAAPLDGTDHSIRGGSYASSPGAGTMTASFRNSEPATSRDPIVGARCARAP